MSWAAFDAAAPDLAAAAHRLIFRSGDGSVLLATVRGDDLPRIHPISVAIVDGQLLAFIILAGPKRRDLEIDGRYAMHSHVDLAAPDEVSIRGRATLVPGPSEAGRGDRRLAVRGRRRLRAVRVRDRLVRPRPPGRRRVAAPLHDLARDAGLMPPVRPVRLRG